MKIELWYLGKTVEPYLSEGIRIYEKRLAHYVKFSGRAFHSRKSGVKTDVEKLKKQETEQILNALEPGDFLILLDEKGKALSSREFAAFLEKKRMASPRRLLFLVGGAFGFSDEMYQRADMKLSLSRMTFSHQMIRLFFVEQLYRAFSIIHNEPYHND